MADIEKQRRIVSELSSRAVSGGFPGEVAVSPKEFESDKRLLLGFFAFPDGDHIERFRRLQRDTAEVFEGCFCVPSHALHLTVKNVRTVSYPPAFTGNHIEAILALVSSARIRKFRFSFSDFLLTPSSLAIAAYGDTNFIRCERQLDSILRDAGVLDNKTYYGGRPMFSNVTILRFFRPPLPESLVRTRRLAISIPPFTVSEIHLLQTNLAMSATATRFHATLRLHD